MNPSFKNFLYYRYIIQKCVELNKVLLVHCEYNGICLSDESKLTFIKLTPYLPESYNVSVIADHVNLNKSDCIKYMPFHSFIKGHKFIIVGKPYIYKNKSNDIKGGLILSDELERFGIKPINFWSPKYLKSIPYNMIIDFRKEFGGIYGWQDSNINNIYITSEQDISRNNNIDKYSFSLNYSENLIHKENNSISTETAKDDQISINNIIKSENSIILFNIINSNKDIKKSFSSKKYYLKNSNIVISTINKNKIRDIDNNLKEFSDSIIIKPIITNHKLPNGVVIPPYRRR